MPRFTNNLHFFKIESQQDREYLLQGTARVGNPRRKIASYIYLLINTTAQLASQVQDMYIIAIKRHKGLAKSKSQELESGFHAKKLGDLRLNFIQNAKHLKNKDQVLPNWHDVCTFHPRKRDQILIENDYVSVQLYLKHN